jgi:hypothetical protein
MECQNINDQLYLFICSETNKCTLISLALQLQNISQHFLKSFMISCPGQKRPLFRPEGDRRPSNGRAARPAEGEGVNGLANGGNNGHAAPKKTDTAIQGCISLRFCFVWQPKLPKQLL